MLNKRRGLVALVSMALASASIPAWADTIERALVQAYQNNPQVNAQRAALRATDENVPQALSGYRPKISATGSYGALYTDQTNIVTSNGRSSNVKSSGWVDPKTVGGTL